MASSWLHNQRAYYNLKSLAKLLRLLIKLSCLYHSTARNSKLHMLSKTMFG